MRTFYLLFLSALTYSSICAQTEAHSLEAQYRSDIGLYISTELDEGKTLYSISKRYNIDLITLMNANDISDANDVSIGSKIIVPIGESVKQSSTNHTDKVYYTVRPKETLYRIAKVYANTSVDHVKQINQLSSNILEIGARLLIGYISIEKSNDVVEAPPVKEKQEISPTVSVPDDIVRTDGPIETPLAALHEIDTTEQDIHELPTLSPVSKVLRGVALTRQTGHDTDGMLVIHPKAKVDSDIIIYNPMMKKAVQAKVVATLDQNTYAHNISVVISPAVAKALGALDRKFWVEMSYIE